MKETSDDKKVKIKQLIDEAYIPAISYAEIKNGNVAVSALGVLNTNTKSTVDTETQFWACSLSKPVFAYLVLKLSQDNVLSLDTPLPWDKNILGSQDDKKLLTPRMILSHQTGLPNEGPPHFAFEFGEDKFRYSGVGYGFLQHSLEKITGKDLETLAKEYLFNTLMKNSTFLLPENKLNIATTHDEAMTPNPLAKCKENDNNAAASLHTTAPDYANFLITAMSDKDFIRLITPQLKSMSGDIDALNVSDDTKKPINWGLGFGLQQNDAGEVSAAFHWGHGPGARTFFAIDPKTQSGFVYLTNSDEGLSIANAIAHMNHVDIKPIMNFLAAKYHYKSIHDDHWHHYHECLISGVNAENNNQFDDAILYYKSAAKIRPDKENELAYRSLWVETLKNSHLIPDKNQLEKIAAKYGPLEIISSSTGLKLNDGSPHGLRDLKLINNNMFLDERVILQLTRDEQNNIEELKINFPNGYKISFARQPELSSQAKIKKALGNENLSVTKDIQNELKSTEIYKKIEKSNMSNTKEKNTHDIDADLKADKESHHSIKNKLK